MCLHAGRRASQKSGLPTRSCLNEQKKNWPVFLFFLMRTHDEKPDQAFTRQHASAPETAAEDAANAALRLPTELAAGSHAVTEPAPQRAAAAPKICPVKRCSFRPGPPRPPFLCTSVHSATKRETCHRSAALVDVAALSRKSATASCEVCATTVPAYSSADARSVRRSSLISRIRPM